MEVGDRAKLGIDRFYDKYPNYKTRCSEEEYEYLGVGAMIIPPVKQYYDKKINYLKEIFK